MTGGNHIKNIAIIGVSKLSYYEAETTLTAHHRPAEGAVASLLSPSWTHAALP